MTHDIVIEFSTSRYTWMDNFYNRVPTGKSIGDFREYHVVSGSVFNDEYTETLDSATIVLSQVPNWARLKDIKAYDYVRVYDKNNLSSFDNLYLIDSFQEKENNIQEHIFSYTINLMSETKWLEKFQCPNRVITHKIDEDGNIIKKTIFEVIQENMDLYVPKIKFCSDGENWSYKPLIEVPGADVNTFQTPILEDRYFHAQGSGWEAIEYLYVSQYFDPNTIKILEVSYEGTIVPDNDKSTMVKYDRPNGRFIIDIYTEQLNPGDEIRVSIKCECYRTNNALFTRFNVPCADMGSSCFTLRQLLTVLMQQVGCIPRVKNRVLTFVDLQKDAVDFAVNGDYSLDNTVNYIDRSLSSDSFVNTLVNISDQVLDSGNEVISETLCFRDKNNTLLKQKENLYLETSFPIYKVNKCILHAPGEYRGYISSNYGCYYPLTIVDDSWDENGVWYPMCYYSWSNVDTANLTAFWSLYLPTRNTINPYNLINGTKVKDAQIHFLGRTTNGSYYILETRSIPDFVADYNSTTAVTLTFGQSGSTQNLATRQYRIDFSGLPAGTVAFRVSGTFEENVENNPRTQKFVFFKFDNAENYRKVDHNNTPLLWPYGPLSGSVTGDGEILACAAVTYDIRILTGVRSLDITPLVVENSVRQLLDRDFTKMVGSGGELVNPDTWTVENFSKYVYGTVGYNIGSKQISGFSDVFVAGSGTALGWVNRDYTYIENITTALDNYWTLDTTRIVRDYFADIYWWRIPLSNGSTTQERKEALYQGTILGLEFVAYDPTAHDVFDSGNKALFSTLFVDLYYQPLNSFNLAYVKENEDVDISIQQYDGNDSGLTDFDRLSIHEQEQVNRVGNETLTINQRAISYNDIRPLNDSPLYFLDDTNRDGNVNNNDNGIKYVIFKRSFTIKNNCFNVNYVGSKDAVLKNYFTSIRTKYRAYQYVDYSQSTLRKERDTIFVRIATDYYNGDDKIWFGNYNTKNYNHSLYFVYDIYSTFKFPISYECECGVGKVSDGLSGYSTENQTIKNSVSLITNKNTLGIIYEYMDNVGAGPYLANNVVENVDLGGIPQSWQIWEEEPYNTKHTVSFVNYIDFYSGAITNDININASNVMFEEIIKIQHSPLVNEYIDLNSSDNVIFSICDNNSLPTGDYLSVQRTFYKDVAETINHTVQFIYYAPNQDVLFGEDFISGTPTVSRTGSRANGMCLSNNDTDFVLDQEEHDVESHYARWFWGTNYYGPGKMSDDFIETGVNADNVPFIRIKWNGFKIAKICRVREENNGGTTQTYWRDIAVFKKPTNEAKTYTDFFFTFNDTKTDYVMGVKNGILYRKYKVKTNINSRKVE